jgi:precorrin-2 dehydrogenase/sirohydrochlorin ferrochelatase
MIPLFVDCSGRRIVIFGGGEVAARKAAYFAGKADVMVVSRSFSEKFNGMQVTRHTLDISTVPDEWLANFIHGAFLVIAALSDRVQNNRVGGLCRPGGVLFNNADGEPGDVILPAVTGGSEYTIAISTGRKSPAVARFLREQIDRGFPALDAMVRLQERLRQELKAAEPDQAKRNAILREVLDNPSVWESLRADPARAWETVRGRYLHE